MREEVPSLFLKGAGFLCIIYGTTALGYLYGRNLECYINHLHALKQIILMIAGEMEYTGYPLGEIFERIAPQLEAPYRNWILYLQREIEKRVDEEFYVLWRRGIEDALSILHLKEKHKRQLMELGMLLGTSNSENALSAIRLSADRLDYEIEIEREQLTAKKRVGYCMGIFGGLFLVILFI
ncbi:MAG: stage III sporulation protein AB [Hespellia sp.]|nr:stage III sporulation protein AB [Hespellia sp.]